MVQRALGQNEAALATFRVVLAAPGTFAGKEEAGRQLAQLEQDAAPAGMLKPKPSWPEPLMANW
jgi:hypothetical protein